MHSITLPAHRRHRTLVIAGVSLLLVSATIGCFVRARGLGTFTAVARRDGFVVHDSPSRAQRAAVKLAYPVSSGKQPPTITASYDGVKDRTRTVLDFRAVQVTGAGALRAGSARLKVVSEFAGTARDPDMGEASVQCTLSLVTSDAGVLAPGSPPGEFVVDGRTLPTLIAFPGQSGYSSKGRADGVHESLAFRVRTPDLLAIARAQHVSARLGAVTLTFTGAQLADLREFAARMNPVLAPASPAYSPTAR